MKKLFIKWIGLLLTLILAFVVSACEVGVKGLADEDLLNVVEVQLIYYNNPGARIWKKSKVDASFDEDKMEIIEILPDNKAQELLTDLRGEVFHWHTDELDTPNSYAMRLLYGDGGCIVISFDPYPFGGKFDNSGNIIEDYGFPLFGKRDSNKFFTTQLQ